MKEDIMTHQSAMQIEGFFDAATGTISYLVLDKRTLQCAIVDSVLDYDPKSGRTSTTSADRLVARIRELNATLQWILETHVHADHLSAAPYLKETLGGQVAIGSHITAVQKFFGRLFNAGSDFSHDGSQFDRLLADDETFAIGSLEVRAMHTPGHTPACMTYVVSDSAESAAFVGDTLFMPDYGTARCDFPGGDAGMLYRSIQRILSLPPETTLYMCHDYLPGGREPRFVSTVAEERATNIHVHEGVGEDEFVAMRQKRDATLEMPVLILPSVQVNMRAGRLPEPESNGTRYIKIPVNAL
jgi:glyoxylase-like metal-dependent hydrolase (beta-lactamase superfamily II)